MRRFNVTASLYLIAALLIGAEPALAQHTRSNLTAGSTPCTSIVTTTSSCVVLSITKVTAGQSTGASVTIGGTFSGTANFLAVTSTLATATPSAIIGYPIGGGTGVTTTSAGGTWQFNTAGVIRLIVNMNPYVSGTAIVDIDASGSGGGGGGGGTSGGGGGASTIANGADVAEGTTTDDRNTSVDATAATEIGLLKQTNYLLSNPVCNLSKIYDTNTNGKTTLVALSSGKITYVCGVSLVQSTTSAVTVSLGTGTGAACVTTYTAITPAWVFPAPSAAIFQGQILNNSSTPWVKTTVSEHLCISTNAAVSVQLLITYGQI